MGISVHNTVVVDGSNPAQTDRLFLGILRNVANAAGGGAGAAVTVALPNAFPGGELPADGSYSVSVDAGQACVTAVTAKTATGFTLTLTPYPATATFAAGKLQIVVEA